MSSSETAMARATSRTYTGWKRACGQGSASEGKRRESASKRFRNRSFGPNTTEGRNTVTSRSSAANTRGAAGADDGLRQLDVRAREIRPVVVGPALVRSAGPAVQHADQVDHRLLVAHQPLEHARRADVGLHDVDGGQQDQVLGALAAPRRHGHLEAARHQLGAHVMADEAGAPDYENVVDLHCPAIL